jgi:hypothetical protein
MQAYHGIATCSGIWRFNIELTHVLLVYRVGTNSKIIAIELCRYCSPSEPYDYIELILFIRISVIANVRVGWIIFTTKKNQTLKQMKKLSVKLSTTTSLSKLSC